MGKTHPHIDSPTHKQLAALVKERPEEIAEIYLALHELMISTLPDIKYSVDEVDASIGYGAHQYGYNGWGMAALTPFGKWVSLTLLQGSSLDDPSGLLEGTAVMRHMKIKKFTDIGDNRAAVTELIRAASELYEQ